MTEHGGYNPGTPERQAWRARISELVEQHRATQPIDVDEVDLTTAAALREQLGLTA